MLVFGSTKIQALVLFNRASAYGRESTKYNKNYQRNGLLCQRSPDQLLIARSLTSLDL